VAGSVGALFVGVGAAALPILVFTGLYQESLFLLATAGGLYALSDPEGRHDAAAAAFLSFACLTRYEAWLLIPFLWLAALAAPRGRRRSYALAASTTSAAVAAWLVFNRGAVSPMGTASLSLVESAADLAAGVRGLWRATTGQHLQILMVAGCALGLAAFRRAPVPLGIAFAILLIDAAFVIVARPYRTPAHPRSAVLPSVVVLWGMGVSWEGLVRDRPRATIVGSGVALLAATLAAPLWNLGNSIRSFSTPALPSGEVARAIDGLGDVGVLVLANGFPAYPDAAPPECLVLRAHAPHARVTCDSSADAESAFASSDVIVQVGDFTPWRTVQQLRSSVAAWPSLHTGSIEVSTRTDGELRALVGSLERPDLGPCATTVGSSDWLAAVRVEGDLVRVEPRRVAFYGNGAVDVPVARDGSMRAWVCGTGDRDGAAELDVALASADGGAASTEHVRTVARATPLEVREAHAGDVLRLRFGNDHVDARGRDRNAFLVGVETGGAP
jgi:hypothetical protein